MIKGVGLDARERREGQEKGKPKDAKEGGEATAQGDSVVVGSHGQTPKERGAQKKLTSQN